MRIIWTILLSLLSVQLFAFEDKHLDIGTFNIAWLGDGDNDKINRSELDYKRITEIIIESGVDLLALQEVENAGSLDRLLKYLPDWAYQIGSSGREQNLAFLYKKEISILEFSEYMPLIVKADRTRPGFWAYMRKGNFDFYIMNIHFKSTSRYDNTKAKKIESFKLRRNQAKALKVWADSLISLNIDDDIIILGDMNDHPKRKRGNLDPIYKNEKLKFISSNLVSCKNPDWDSIDHIVITQSVTERKISFSERIYNQYFSFQEDSANKISDHCMIIFSVDINQKDND